MKEPLLYWNVILLLKLMTEKLIPMNNKHSLIFFIFAIVGFLTSPVQAQSDYRLAEQDSLALVAFYWATDGPNWISNQPGFGFDDLSTEWQGTYDGGFNNWFDGPVKDWFGVRVEKRPILNSSDSVYRVTWLWPVIGRRTDGQNQLNGYIPREIAWLTMLEQFRVNGNDGFRWTEIPDDLYHGTLEHMDIESAWFGGYISDALRNCTGIRKMNYRYNYIDYMPTLDFLDSEALYNLNGTQWWYSTRLSFAIIEKTIDYFYTISPNPKEFGIEARDLFEVGDEQEVVAALGSQVEMECTSAGEQEEYITYQWFKNGLSMFGKAGRTLTISSVKESDYADYTVKITNEYVKEYDQNSNYGDVFTKPFHLVAEPVPPVIARISTSYNGKEIILRFSKPMDTQAEGYEGFTISAGSRALSATAASTDGRLDLDLVLVLNEPLFHDDTITLSYSGSSVIDKNGGVLATFSDSIVENLVRQAPVLVSAQTTRDGSGIEVAFDKYIDQHSIDAADFTVIREGDGSISTATLLPGELDAHISKSVLLTLSDPISDSTEALSLKYTSGELAGHLSGVVSSSDTMDVTNQVSVDLMDVLITFEDGSLSLENILINASWKVDPIQLYDDGTHGDTVAGDFNWATTASLVEDSYSWDVFSRETLISYDTARVEDPETGIITLVITPYEEYTDSILSENVVLEFEVAGEQISGITSFGIKNIDVTFIVQTGQSSEEIYLMGIEEDWGLGINMTLSGGAYQYTATVQGYTEGDIIEYNYRDGNNWENQTVEPRSYVVVKGENIVSDIFGDFTTSFEDLPMNEVTLYPNPVSGILNLSGLDGANSIEVFNFSGSLVQKSFLFEAGTFSTDVSDYQDGIYLLRINYDHRKEITIRFIKY